MKCHQTGCHSDAAPNRKMCEPCLVRQREWAKARRLARLAAGTCVQCDSSPLPGLTRCQKHHAMQRRAWERANAEKLAGYHERQAERRKKVRGEG